MWLITSLSLVLLGLMMLFSAFVQLKSGEVLVLKWVLSVVSWNIFLSFFMDFESLSFGGVVLMVSGSVYLFSLSYMSEEKYFSRFMLLVSVFIFSVLMLIFSGNVLQVILGWDGLGLSSYLLVCYYNNKNSSNAGGLTLVTNRLGDVGLILLIYLSVISSSQILSVGTKGMVVAGLLMFVSVTKSAQLPFSAWLPAAMAAPTPVSSLVHSSTLVTAGVYLMIRIYESLSSLLKSVLILGVMTSLMAVLVAMVERDMKKIVALSTLSHLGIMVSMLGFGWVQLSFSHLVFHAFFKALLFLVVGYWIHSSAGYQDLVKISGVSIREPVVSSFGGLALMSLCGLPYLTGFYSKDFFLEVGLQVGSNLVGMLLLLLSCLGSLVYSVRMFLMVNNMSNSSKEMSWEGSGFYVMSMLLLSLCAVVSGGVWVNYWVLENSVLFIFWEMKLLLTMMILVCMSVGFVNIKSVPLSEMGFLASISRITPNLVTKTLSKESVKLDSSYLSPYFNKYEALKVSTVLMFSETRSFLNMMLLMSIEALFLLMLVS